MMFVLKNHNLYLIRHTTNSVSWNSQKLALPLRTHHETTVINSINAQQ